MNLLLAASMDVDECSKTTCREVFLTYQAVRAGDEALLSTSLENWP
jgi:hypothetical protein